jgi:hypothetical protein
MKSFNPMKSLRFWLAISVGSVAFVGAVRAEDKEPAKPAACCCCCTKDGAGADQKTCGKDGCCCGEKAAKPVEKVMPKSSYNRKS